MPFHKSYTTLFFSFLGGIILLFIIAPLAGLFFSTEISGLKKIISDTEVTSSIWLTLWTAMSATIICSFAAVPFAYLLARKNFLLKNLINAIIDLPIVIPHLAAGIALLGVVSRGSVTGKWLNEMGLVFVGNNSGIILAMAFVSIPFLINAARDGFQAVPVRLEKAALNLGASPIQVFFTISIPLAWRSILSGFVMMWARGMSEFGAVIVLAYNPKTTPVLIFERFNSFGLSYSRPVTALFIIICLSFFILLRILSRTRKNADR